MLEIFHKVIKMVLNLERKFLIFMTMILLLFNKVIIKIVSFKKILNWYSNTSETFEPTEFNGEELNKVKRIFSLMRSCKKKVFWQSLCFDQSLTVLCLARIHKLPCVVSFGVKKDEMGKMSAHAWSRVGIYDITGFENRHEYTEVFKMYYKPKLRTIQ